MRADISTVLVAWWQHLFIALGHCQRAWIVQCFFVFMGSSDRCDQYCPLAWIYDCKQWTPDNRTSVFTYLHYTSQHLPFSVGM